MQLLLHIPDVWETLFFDTGVDATGLSVWSLAVEAEEEEEEKEEEAWSANNPDPYYRLSVTSA